MIARIAEVHQNSEKVTLVANLYETAEKKQYTVEKASFEKAKKDLGIKEDGFLEIDIDTDEKGEIYLLLVLLADCYLGPNAKLPCKEVKGLILEIDGRKNLHIETSYEDKYVVCRCEFPIIERYHEIFSRQNLTRLPGFYYNHTNEAYIGYHLDKKEE